MGVCKLRSVYVLFAIFILLLVTNLGTQFWSDDLCRVMPFGDGLFGESLARTSQDYVSWSGRVVVTALTYLAINFSFHYTQFVFDLISSIVFVFLLLGIFRISVGRMPCNSDGAVLLFLFVLVWLGVDSIGEVSLWKTGAVGYLWVVTAGVWVLVPYADLVLRNIIVMPLTFRSAMISTGLVAICGLGLENFTACVFMAQVAAVGIGLRRKLNFKVLLPLIIPAVLMMAALVVMVFSPGNIVRASMVRAQVGESSGFLSKVLPFSAAALSVYANSWLAYLLVYLFVKEKSWLVRRQAIIFLILSLVSCYVLIAAPGIQTGGRRNFATQVFLVVAIFGLWYQMALRKLQSKLFSRLVLGSSIFVYFFTGCALVFFNYNIRKTEINRQEILASFKENGKDLVVFPPLDVAWLGARNKERIAWRMFFFDDIVDSNSSCYARAYGAEGIVIKVAR